MRKPRISDEKFNSVVKEINKLEEDMDEAISNQVKENKNIKIDEEPLKEYPHGYNAFYMTVKKSIQTED